MYACRPPQRLAQGAGLEPATHDPQLILLYAKLHISHFFIIALPTELSPHTGEAFSLLFALDYCAYGYGNLPETVISIKWPSPCLHGTHCCFQNLRIDLLLASRLCFHFSKSSNVLLERLIRAYLVLCSLQILHRCFPEIPRVCGRLTF